MKFCPFSVFLFVSSAGAYVYSSRRVIMKKESAEESAEGSAGDNDNDGDNNNDKFTVVFVLGGPGSGKGTQCELLTQRLEGWVHLSAGDLLRAERQNPDSELGGLINDKISAGQIVPAEITVRLIRNAMEAASANNQNAKFLIDGFPRSVGNVTVWKAQMSARAQTAFVLNLDCPEDVMTSRLLERGQTSGRSDDNLDVIRKRFVTHRETALPIVQMYEGEGLLRTIVADRSVEDVYVEVSKLFQGL
jgi:UMP-CMP kinase